MNLCVCLSFFFFFFSSRRRHTRLQGDWSSDVCSSDLICARDPRVSYLRRDVRGGIDADLASCIDAARGEYCWLFSGDDTLQSGGVAYVLSALESGVDVHLLTHTDCTLDMQILRVHPALATIGPLRADLGQRDARRLWLTQALNTEALFSFASTLVVRRQTWNSMPARHDFDRSGWGHVAPRLG